MALLETVQLNIHFPFRFLINYGYRLTTPHLHGEYEIIYVEKGSLNLGVGNDLYRLEEKEIFVIRPYIEHYIVPEPESVRYIYQFSSSIFSNIFVTDNISKLQDLNPISLYWDKGIKQEIMNTLLQIKNEFDIKKDSYCLQIISDLLKIYVLLDRNECHDHKEYKETKMISSLKSVFEYVENHFRDKVYIEDVAEFLGYSTEYFSRFFKKNIGLNFSDFLLDYRLTKARWDLLTTEDSIHQVIYNNGFSNTATFYRNFKEYSGYSPKEYREHYRK